DEDVNIGCILNKPGDILGLSQVDDVSGRVDLMGRAEPLGNRLQLIAAAGGKPDMSAFFGECFGSGRADAFRCACDQDTFAAQMEIHEISRLVGKYLEM